jgi:hypothetical protein
MGGMNANSDEERGTVANTDDISGLKSALGGDVSLHGILNAENIGRYS